MLNPQLLSLPPSHLHVDIFLGRIYTDTYVNNTCLGGYYVCIFVYMGQLLLCFFRNRNQKKYLYHVDVVVIVVLLWYYLQGTYNTFFAMYLHYLFLQFALRFPCHRSHTKHKHIFLLVLLRIMIIICCVFQFNADDDDAQTAIMMMTMVVVVMMM